jgi:ferrochelatase
MSLPQGHPDIRHGKTGLLLVNLGTPAAPTAAAIRPYLKQFLSDNRVIETSALIWQPILRGIILNLRPQKSAKAYKKIWREESNESPLRYYTRQQAEILAQRLASDCKVYWAMRYGAPSIDSQLDAMRADGCERICVVALYPQYSATTSASVYDEVFRSLMRMRWQPAIRTAAPWHDHPNYIAALATSLKEHLDGLAWQPDKIIASYHGLPQAYFDKGDPYHCHCYKTTRLLRDHLGYDEDQLITTFQSRFGPTKWLEPYTDKTVMALAQQGVKRLVVITPGFISDCVETLEEISIELAHSFAAQGGEEFATVACLNDSAGGMDILEEICRRELSGWI